MANYGFAENKQKIWVLLCYIRMQLQCRFRDDGTDHLVVDKVVLGGR